MVARFWSSRDHRIYHRQTLVRMCRFGTRRFNHCRGNAQWLTDMSSTSSTSNFSLAKRWNSISSNIVHWGEMATEDSRVRLVWRESCHISHTRDSGPEEGTNFFPVPPASPATTLSCTPPGHGTPTSTPLAPPCSKRICATSRGSSPGKRTATRRRGLVIDQGKAGLVLNMEVCKRTRGATTKSLSTFPLRSACRTARVAGTWQANGSLAILACGVIPVCKPTEFV